MPKTIMRAFRLAEISAVDRPAQAHARMAIMKRAADHGYRLPTRLLSQV